MQTDEIQKLQFYQTSPHPCSYLPDREARTIFLDPAVPLSKALYSRMLTAGFRRSGDHLYRPGCETCQACVSCRVQVQNFTLSRRFKRVTKRNQDLVSKELTSLDDPAIYALYSHYIETRHTDGDMYPPSPEQYQNFIETRTESTKFFGFYEQSRLLAVSVIDELDHGLSAMYTFFDPELNKRSLGSYIILWQIEKARQLNLPYVYLGYWVKDCDKMRYKTDFQPLEMFVGNGWELFTEAP
ncbi:MAG: arginyltransferase [Gammaproteobacteria bacterium]